jgi:hypothetical protein
MTFAVSSAGLATQTQAEVQVEIASKLQSVFGVGLNTEITSLTGQFIAILAELRAYDQQVVLAVWRSFDPNGAVGAALDRLGSLTGSIRLGATSSTVRGIFTCSGIVPVIANGVLVRNEDTGTIWEVINGPYATAGGPYPEAVAAQIQAVDTGPVIAPATTTWALVTPIANVTSFTNPVEDASLGRDLETDAAFRARRLVELYSSGQGPLVSIAAVVSRVNTADGYVESARVYHNPQTNPVDSDGIPFKAFNVVVETSPSPPPSGLQQSIFDAILTATGAGGYPYGTDYTGTAEDAEGQSQAIAFDLVGQIDVYLAIEITTSASPAIVVPLDPDTMAELIRDACVDAATTLYTLIGRSFRVLDYVGVITSLIASGELQGIDAVTVQVSDVSKLGPYDSNFVPISIRDKIDLDSGEVRVVIDGVAVIP